MGSCSMEAPASSIVSFETRRAMRACRRMPECPAMKSGVWKPAYAAPSVPGSSRQPRYRQDKEGIDVGVKTIVDILGERRFLATKSASFPFPPEFFENGSDPVPLPVCRRIMPASHACNARIPEAEDTPPAMLRCRCRARVGADRS